ncbi:competence protein ComK [Virgibacillus byunsanensis]|uniref:Competence protein ComK n=1 Tax=Virgibacillus byunsanensis TaxID=570945 RepID=A0ABW3LH65_9BACI
MTDVLVNYHINNQTMVLQPASHFEYNTIVYEVNRTLFVNKTAIQLIKAACLSGGAAYDGRRTAVMYQTGANRKVPIPISPSKNIFAFPTRSPSKFDCHWIFYNHIESIKPTHTSQKNTKSIFSFKNGQQLAMNESYYLLEKQMQRTAFCILQYTAFLNHRFTI